VTTDALEPWTATALSAAVRAGSTSPLDAVRESLRRIDERDAELGAFQVVRRDAATREAAGLQAAGTDLPLADVPVAIKDNIPVEGEPMRDGSAATEGWPQKADHEVVRRIRAAGGIVVGLTRVPELCVWGATDSVYGVTRNPWDLDRTPGGSSGGSAAAVASGQVPIAHGNDGMGSIRIPAACAGLVGIKPGQGVVPCDLGETDWYGLSENGPIATTVADTALLLSVMADDPSLADLDADLGPLCIAVSTKPPLQGVTVDREHVRALFQTAGALKTEGHAVERFDPVYPNGAAIAGLARWFAGTWSDAQHLDQSLLEPRNRTHAAIGRRIVERGLLSEKPRDAWKAKAAEIFETFDVLMTPVLATPPIESKRWSDENWATSMAANVRYAPFAAAWNVASFPAMSVPAGVHPQYGTPMSVQLVAAPGKERLLLSLAARIEALRPWQRVAPSYA
jgi:amidase